MNILIIKTEALGDVVRTTFVAQALKDKYKNIEPKIFWITNKNAKQLFINNPYIDVLIFDENRNKLINKEFDIVINLEENEQICKFVSAIKAKEKIGFLYKEGKIVPSPSAKEWFDMSALGEKPKNDILKKRNKKTHRQIISEIINIQNCKKYSPFLRLSKKQRVLANNFLRRHNLSRSDLIIGINTGAADKWPKALPIEKTVKLINQIYKKFDAKIILFGGPNEIERNREIVKLSRVHVIDVGCGNDLFEFPALISICNLFITSDSLGLHIALALKRKTICLVGPTSPTEIDMYNLGEKVVSKSKCICCYKKNCKSIEKIDLNEVFLKINKFLAQKIAVLITAFKEPRIGKAIESIINQKTNLKYDIVVSAPDKETINIAKKYAKKDKRIKIFKDPGKGKSFALNMLLDKIKTDILILTDGDVYVNDRTIETIYHFFLNPEIGCLTGRPVPIENKKTKYGYWANFLFGAAHRLRKEAFENNSFIECSGYLFAFRKKYVNKIPLDVAEDAIIPYYFWEKGFAIGYADKAEVYIRNVDNWGDWIKQKTRTAKAHENLNKYVNTKITPRVKTFSTEAKAIRWLLGYPSNPQEFIWTTKLAIARLYMWIKVYIETRLKGKLYGDAWERIESTK